MKKWVTIIMLWACVAALWGINASQASASYANRLIATQQSHQQTCPAQQQSPHSATIYPDHGTNGEATLTDSSSLLQLCSSRAERTTSNPLKVKRLLLHYTGCGATVPRGQSCSRLCAVGGSSPVLMESQSRHYVYRLRRMRC